MREGRRLFDGNVREALTQAQLEAFYGAPIETLTDRATGATCRGDPSLLKGDDFSLPFFGIMR